MLRKNITTIDHSVLQNKNRVKMGKRFPYCVQKIVKYVKNLFHLHIYLVLGFFFYKCVLSIFIE